MTEPTSDTAVFEAALQDEPGAWGAAKRDAFARLCEAFPGRDGPTREGLRQLQRGQFDARVPREWKPVFVEVYLQWLGFAEEQALLRPPPLLSPRWWIEPMAPSLRQAPTLVRRVASPLFLAAFVIALAGLRCAHGVAARDDARHRLRVQAESAEVAAEELADVERLALASFREVSDDGVASFLAGEPGLRSRYESAEARRQDLARATDTAKEALRTWHFPRWGR